jgi:hypothetical protein
MIRSARISWRSCAQIHTFGRSATASNLADPVFAGMGFRQPLPDKAARLPRCACSGRVSAGQALNVGWTPQALAGFTGANTRGVRNPYAVLAARLSPAELPPPHLRRPPKPPWCGECDQATRMLGFDGDAPRPCPRCKSSAAASSAAYGENGRFG